VGQAWARWQCEGGTMCHWNLASLASEVSAALSQHHWLSQRYILTFQCMCFLNTSILCLVVLVLGTAYCKPLLSHKRNGQCVVLNICGISATESYAFQQNCHSTMSSVFSGQYLVNDKPVAFISRVLQAILLHISCKIVPCFWNCTISLIPWGGHRYTHTVCMCTYVHDIWKCEARMYV